MPPCKLSATHCSDGSSLVSSSRKPALIPHQVKCPLSDALRTPGPLLGKHHNFTFNSVVTGLMSVSPSTAPSPRLTPPFPCGFVSRDSAVSEALPCAGFAELCGMSGDCIPFRGSSSRRTESKGGTWPTHESRVLCSCYKGYFSTEHSGWLFIIY